MYEYVNNVPFLLLCSDVANPKNFASLLGCRGETLVLFVVLEWSRRTEGMLELFTLLPTLLHGLPVESDLLVS